MKSSKKWIARKKGQMWNKRKIVKMDSKFTGRKCCVEAECHFCYLGDSELYVHESCCPGNQRHLPTYVGCRRFWYGPLTKYGS
jgi:hypothetical protein